MTVLSRPSIFKKYANAELQNDFCSFRRVIWTCDLIRNLFVARRLRKQLGIRRKSTESGRKKTRKRQGWSIRRADKMQRELSLQQRKRNRRSGQMTYMTLECQNEIFRMAK